MGMVLIPSTGSLVQASADRSIKSIGITSMSKIEIWRSLFLKDAPVAENVDFEFLAKRFKVAGGNVKNIYTECSVFGS